MGDLHVDVVDDDTEMVERMPVGTHENEIVERFGRKLDSAADQIVDHDRLRRHLQAHDVAVALSSPPLPFFGRNLPSGARVSIGTALRLRLLAVDVELLRSLKGTVGLSLRQQSFDLRAVE